MAENTLTKAVKQLRLALGETQQSFAAKLGLAISTVVRYESNRPPKDEEVLWKFYDLALSVDRRDLADHFRDASLEHFRQTSKRRPQTIAENVLAYAFLLLFRNGQVPEIVEWGDRLAKLASNLDRGDEILSLPKGQDGPGYGLPAPTITSDELRLLQNEVLSVTRPGESPLVKAAKRLVAKQDGPKS